MPTFRYRRTSGTGPSRSLLLSFILIVSLAGSVAVRMWPSSLETGFFLGDKVDHFLDLEGTATIDDMVANPSRLESPRGQLVNRGVQGGVHTALWLRLKVPPLPGAPQQDWTLSLQETRVREVRLYVEAPDAPHRERVVRPGVRDPVSGLVPRFAAFNFEAGEIAGKTLWMRVYTRSSKRALLWLEPREAFVSGELRQTLMFGILAGVLVALFCYLLALGAILKEGALVLLALFVAFFFVYVVSDRAFAEALIIPGALQLSRFASIISTLGCYAAWTAFLLRYLHVKAHFRLLHFLGLLLIGTAGILSCIAAFEVANDTYWLRRILPWYGIAIVTLGAAIAVLSYRTEPARALAFAICWSPAILAVLARLLLDASPNAGGSAASVYSIYVAAAFSVLCFAIVLSLDLQQREHRLRLSAEQQEARFRSFANSASDGFWETDQDGNLLSLTGPTAGLIKPQKGTFHQALHDLGADETALATLQRHLEDQRAFRGVEANLVPSSGPPMTVELNGEPFWQSEGFAGFRGILTDISERKRRQEGEVRQQRMAAIGQLASGIAHEINSLLHPIINLSRRVKDNHALDDAARRALDIVLVSGDRAKDILTNLLASAHPSKVIPQTLPLLQATAEICDEIGPLISSQVDLKVRIDGRDGPLVSKSELYQVISNLVANAVHAMPERGRLAIEGYRHGEGGFCLTVSDDGHGMSEEVAGKILEPFFTTKPIGSGTGLGLATVASIVKAWKGTIGVDTAPRKGTSITILIPEEAPSDTRAP